MIQITVLFRVLVLAILLASTVSAPAGAGESEQKADTAAVPVEEQIRSLEEMCAENSDAMAARKTEKSLYERLGGQDGIQKIVTEIVRLHDENPVFDRFMDEVDKDALIQGVSHFVVSGTGGPDVYEGRDLVSAHAHLKLSNADFLAAGGDVMQAMENMGCEKEEIHEMVCILVSLRDRVVVEADRSLD